MDGELIFRKVSLTTKEEDKYPQHHSEVLRQGHLKRKSLRCVPIKEILEATVP